MSIGFRAETGNGNQWDPLEARLLAQPFGNVVAVDIRQTDIEQDRVRLELHRGLQTGTARMRHQHGMTRHLEPHREASRRVDIVVDDQDAPGRAAADRSAGMVRFLRGDLAHQRQPHDEFRTATDAVADRLDRATVQLDEPADQGESDAETALRAVERRIHLREELEHALQHLWRYADTVVPHAQNRMARQPRVDL